MSSVLLKAVRDWHLQNHWACIANGRNSGQGAVASTLRIEQQTGRNDDLRLAQVCRPQ